MIMRNAGLLFLFICFGPTQALATNANLGSDISSAVAQNLMGSPPLPSLEGGSLTLSPQYGYVEVEATGEYSVNNDPYKYKGTAKGNTFGLSLSGSSKNGWGFFIYGGYSRLTGDIESSNASGAPGDGLKDIKAESMGGAAAITYRLIGSDKSTFAMGVFSGPAYIGVKSNAILDVNPPSGGQAGQAKYEFNPTTIGALSGVQVAWRLGDFLINPYVTYYLSQSPLCQSVDYETLSGQVTDSSFQCNGEGTKKLSSNPMFISLGLFLGYKSFRVNVLSTTSTLETLYVSNYSASFGISF